MKFCSILLVFFPVVLPTEIIAISSEFFSYLFFIEFSDAPNHMVLLFLPHFYTITKLHFLCCSIVGSRSFFFVHSLFRAINSTRFQLLSHLPSLIFRRFLTHFVPFSHYVSLCLSLSLPLFPSRIWHVIQNISSKKQDFSRHILYRIFSIHFFWFCFCLLGLSGANNSSGTQAA